MLTLPSSVRVYLAAAPVDLRRGHDGLVALVRGTWKLNPFDGHLFVFLGKRLDSGEDPGLGPQRFRAVLQPTVFTLRLLRFQTRTLVPAP